MKNKLIKEIQKASISIIIAYIYLIIMSKIQELDVYSTCVGAFIVFIYQLVDKFMEDKDE